MVNRTLLIKYSFTLSKIMQVSLSDIELNLQFFAFFYAFETRNHIF